MVMHEVMLVLVNMVIDKVIPVDRGVPGSGPSGPGGDGSNGNPGGSGLASDGVEIRGVVLGSEATEVLDEVPQEDLEDLEGTGGAWNQQQQVPHSPQGLLYQQESVRTVDLPSILAGTVGIGDRTIRFLELLERHMMLGSMRAP